jgi:2-amino-4-hydroxy-6-hydroxymethyldihydropteridine diphosphokinase
VSGPRAAGAGQAGGGPGPDAGGGRAARTSSPARTPSAEAPTEQDLGGGGDPDPQRGPAQRAHLGLGSNLGDRLGFLQGAVTALAATPGVEVVAVSRVYETTPVGGPRQGPYLNAVVALDTELGADDLLDVTQRIEAAAGRRRVERWGPRSLDVDVLLVGDERITSERLTVPHPRLFERGFVLAPLADVAPALVERPDGGWAGVEPTDLALDPSRPGICYEPPP